MTQQVGIKTEIGGAFHIWWQYKQSSYLLFSASRSKYFITIG